MSGYGTTCQVLAVTTASSREQTGTARRVNTADSRTAVSRASPSPARSPPGPHCHSEARARRHHSTMTLHCAPALASHVQPGARLRPRHAGPAPARRPGAPRWRYTLGGGGFSVCRVLPCSPGRQAWKLRFSSPPLHLISTAMAITNAF